MHWSDLEVWKKSHQLVIKIYDISKAFPKDEQYGLVSQIKRSSFSIPVNIVEGQSRQSTKEYLQFLNISRGSLEELRYTIILSHDLKMIDEATSNEILSDCELISKLLNGLIRFLRGKV